MDEAAEIMDVKKSNFTQTPNIVFDLLESDCDIVAYQRLLRAVGMGNSFKGGVRSLAAKLNISVGKVVKLGAKLKEVGFIDIKKGDNAHGESDTWEVLDIWHLNTCSRKDTGADTEIAEAVINPPFCALPVHETEQPCSRNDTATCSPNDTVIGNNIFSREDIQDLDISLSARAPETIPIGKQNGILVSDLDESKPKEIHFIAISDGMKDRLGTPGGLPKEYEWRTAINFAWINNFSPERFLDTYDLLEKIRKKKRGAWKVTAGMVENNIADSERLEIELRNLENGTNANQNGKGIDNGSGYGKQDHVELTAQLRRLKRQPANF